MKQASLSRKGLKHGEHGNVARGSVSGSDIGSDSGFASVSESLLRSGKGLLAGIPLRQGPVKREF